MLYIVPTTCGVEYANGLVVNMHACLQAGVAGDDRARLVDDDGDNDDHQMG